jgi:phenylacetate-coenzyme A ligase PaaK-like adenylate-forming protein
VRPHGRHLRGGILGRVDDMKLIRGTNVYPRAVEAIVREYPESRSSRS